MKQKKISGGLRKKGILKKDKKNLPLISIITFDEKKPKCSW